MLVFPSLLAKYCGTTTADLPAAPANARRLRRPPTAGSVKRFNDSWTAELPTGVTGSGLEFLLDGDVNTVTTIDYAKKPYVQVRKELRIRGPLVMLASTINLFPRST